MRSSVVASARSIAVLIRGPNPCRVHPRGAYDAKANSLSDITKCLGGTAGAQDVMR